MPGRLSVASRQASTPRAIRRPFTCLLRTGREAGYKPNRRSSVPLPALVLLVALSAPLDAGPACSPPRSPKIDAVPDFAGAVVDAIGWARRGASRLQLEGSRAVSAVQASLLRTQDDFACSCRYVAPFTKSDRESIRANADDLLARCEANRDGAEAVLKALDRQSAEAGGPGAQEADAAMARAVEAKDRAWGEYLLGFANALDAVVEVKDGALTGRVLLTRAERGDLRARLEREFGPEVTRGVRDEQVPLVKVASGWYALLADPKFKAADEK
jgi:hypothetical protein